MAKHARILLKDDRAITSLRYSICAGASGNSENMTWSFVTLDSILKYCSPDNAQHFCESLVAVSKEILEAKEGKRNAPPAPATSLRP
jgi:hypothetical protein